MNVVLLVGKLCYCDDDDMMGDLLCNVREFPNVIDKLNGI